MVHESERSFEDRAYDHYASIFGEDAVTRQKYLRETYRFCDLWIDLPDAGIGLAIEVENDFEAAFKGMAQAVLYSKHTDYHHPMVILPVDHVEQPEAGMLREDIIIQELDV